MPDFPLLLTAHSAATYADELCRRFGLHLVPEQHSGLVLLLDQHGLQLKNLDEAKTGGVMVDFAGGKASWRRQHGGGLQEAVAKAVGVKGNWQPHVFDATAGLGRDSFVLASLGCKLSMSERSPVVAALLADGLKRAQLSDAADIVARMQLLQGNACELMQHWEQPKPDVVYLDPMFPHRKKSAAVKKEMRLFQQLLGPDLDADALLLPAQQLAARRVVVKRPADAPWLANAKPDIEMKGKANRFDIYLTFTS